MVYIATLCLIASTDVGDDPQGLSHKDAETIEQLTDLPTNLRVRLLYRAALRLRDDDGVSNANSERVYSALNLVGYRSDFTASFLHNTLA